MSSPLPPPARMPRWKRWLLASLALTTLVLVWRFALVPLGSSGPEGSGTGASSSRASSASPAAEKHLGPVSSLDGARPELFPEGAGSLELNGLVTGAQGQPLDGVEIVLRAKALSSLDRPLSATTDTDYSEQKLPAPASGVEVVLRSGAGLEVVVDEENQPVAGATCMLVPDQPWPSARA